MWICTEQSAGRTVTHVCVYSIAVEYPRCMHALQESRCEFQMATLMFRCTEESAGRTLESLVCTPYQ